MLATILKNKYIRRIQVSFSVIRFRILLSLKRSILRNSSEWHLLSNLQHSLVQNFAASKFTEHFPGSNKVHYVISGRNDFCCSDKSMVSRKIYFNVKCPHFTIYHNLTYHPILNSFENNVFLLNPSLQIMNIHREY